MIAVWIAVLFADLVLIVTSARRFRAAWRDVRKPLP